MQYILLIYGPDQPQFTPDEGRKMMSEYREFTDDIKRTGHFKAGDALQSVKTATTVRVRDGKVQRTDGPFAETKEQLGGVFLTELPDLDEAIRIGGLIPAAEYGTLEIRPLISR